jgi:hypothetical protein
MHPRPLSCRRRRPRRCHCSLQTLMSMAATSSPWKTRTSTSDVHYGRPRFPSLLLLVCRRKMRSTPVVAAPPTRSPFRRPLLPFPSWAMVIS